MYLTLHPAPFPRGSIPGGDLSTIPCAPLNAPPLSLHPPGVAPLLPGTGESRVRGDLRGMLGAASVPPPPSPAVLRRGRAGAPQTAQEARSGGANRSGGGDLRAARSERRSPGRRFAPFSSGLGVRGGRDRGPCTGKAPRRVWCRSKIGGKMRKSGFLGVGKGAGKL